MSFCLVRTVLYADGRVFNTHSFDLVVHGFGFGRVPSQASLSDGFGLGPSQVGVSIMFEGCGFLFIFPFFVLFFFWFVPIL